MLLLLLTYESCSGEIQQLLLLRHLLLRHLLLQCTVTMSLRQDPLKLPAESTLQRILLLLLLLRLGLRQRIQLLLQQHIHAAQPSLWQSSLQSTNRGW